MNPPLPPRHTGLQNATHHQLEHAAAENYRQLFCLNALVLGGEVLEGEGISWTYAGPDEASAVCFPSLTDENASRELDKLMDHYRVHPPYSAGYWSLDPPQPAGTGARLLARGWQPGWKPCWMVKDLLITEMDQPAIAGLQINPDNDTPIRDLTELPYSGDSAYMSSALLKQYPERAQRFIARMEGIIVGQCCLFYSDGAYGLAGMYNVGVIPAQRRKGIAKAIVLAACRHAQASGFRYVMLNANGEGRPVYEKAGFDFISYGLTWWLMGNAYITHPPSPDHVRFAEAIGTGDIGTLDQLIEQLPSTMTNKMSWVQLAVECRQPASAEWLINHHVNYSALDAWDLGWKEKAAALLAADPQEVNRRYFDWGATLAHTAAQRGDTALLRLALNFTPDLTIPDLQHHATPMDWAIFFRREDQVELLNSYINERK